MNDLIGRMNGDGSPNYIGNMNPSPDEWTQQYATPPRDGDNFFENSQSEDDEGASPDESRSRSTQSLGGNRSNGGQDADMIDNEDEEEDFYLPPSQSSNDFYDIVYRGRQNGDLVYYDEESRDWMPALNSRS